ncbi:unnamed protein product, partial [marine sediment metagenome]
AEILREMGFNPFVSEVAHQLTVNSKQLYTFLKTLRRAGDKYIPQDFKKLPPDKLKILFDWLMKGDGCCPTRDQERGNRHYMYSSKSKKLIDDIQEIALKLGWVSGVHVTYGSGYNPEGIYYHIS